MKNNVNGLIEQLKRALTAVGRQQSGLYSIEGVRLHQRALRAGVGLQSSLLGHSFAQSEAAAQLLPSLNEVHILPDAQMHSLTNGRDLGQIISLLPLPNEQPLAEQLTAVAQPLLLVAADVVDPGNVGAMIRTGHAHGIDAFVAVGVSDPFHPKAVRTSMGSLFKTAVYRRPHLAELVSELQALGIETVATVAEGGHLLPETDFASGTAVFMGNEYFGLPADVGEQLDKKVRIPMYEGIDSLSVNAATAVVLYEIRRQQGPHWPLQDLA